MYYHFCTYISLFSLPGFVLEPHITYVFHVRVWYNSTHYGVYSTDGVQTDALPPEISSSRKVKEITQNSPEADVDFIGPEDALTVTWAHVFRDAHAAIDHYNISIGAYCIK